MTLSDMASYICTKTGQSDADSVAAAKTFLARRYQMLWDAALWKESLSIVSVQVPNWSTICSLNFPVDQVVAVRTSSTGLGSQVARPLDQPALMRYDPAVFDQTGIVAGFAMVAPSCLQQVSARSGSDALASYFGFQLSSSDLDDTTQTVTVTGYGTNSAESGFPRNLAETVALFGAGGANTVNKYAAVTSITLDQPTAGAVTMFDVSGFQTVGVIPPGELSTPLLPRINIFGATASSFFKVLVKRLAIPLAADGQEPELRSCANTLLAYATADMLERQRQYAKAQLKEQQGQSMLQNLLDLEKNQSASEICLVPIDINGSIPDATNAFGAQGKSYW